jgi:hypothetical protein
MSSGACNETINDLGETAADRFAIRNSSRAEHTHQDFRPAQFYGPTHCWV